MINDHLTYGIPLSLKLWKLLLEILPMGDSVCVDSVDEKNEMEHFLGS